MSRIRTLSETYLFIKEMDADTAITPNALRQMVVSGRVPCIKAGKKYLLDVDVLLEFLKGVPIEKTKQESFLKMAR